MKNVMTRLFVLYSLIVLYGCGGGGGGAPAATSEVTGDQQGQTPTDTTTNNPPDTTGIIDTALCTEILDDLNLDIPTALQNGPSDCDYYVERNARFTSNVTIAAGTTIVMASNAGISLRGGSISAVGTEALPIRILGEQRVQGFWEGIVIDDARASTLAYIEISDGGNNNFSDGSHGLEVEGESIISIDNVSVSNSFNAGMRLKGRAIELVSFTNNQFFNNALEGLVADFTYVPDLDSTTDYSGGNRPNGLQELRVADIFNQANASVDTGDTAVLPNLGVDYRFKSIQVSGTLSIEPGVRLVLQDNTSISVYGTLMAEGTPSQPIVFVARDDDAPYESIRLNGTFVGSSVQFINGGKTTSTDTNKGIFNLSGAGAMLSLTDASFDGSATWGVYCNGFANPVTPENLTLSNVTFTNMAEGNFSDGCGVSP